MKEGMDRLGGLLEMAIMSQLLREMHGERDENEPVVGYVPRFSHKEEHMEHLQEAAQRAKPGERVTIMKNDGEVWKEGVVYPSGEDCPSGTFALAWIDDRGDVQIARGPICSIFTPTLRKRLAKEGRL